MIFLSGRTLTNCSSWIYHTNHCPDQEALKNSLLFPFNLSFPAARQGQITIDHSNANNFRHLSTSAAPIHRNGHHIRHPNPISYTKYTVRSRSTRSMEAHRQSHLPLSPREKLASFHMLNRNRRHMCQDFLQNSFLSFSGRFGSISWAAAWEY